MDKAKTLVLYYSRSGNTRNLAEEIAKKLHADIEEIHCKERYRFGSLGFFRAIAHVLLRRTPEIFPLEKKTTDYGTVIIGTPVWWSAPAAPVRTFLETHRNELGDVAFFSTQGGSSPSSKLYQEMKKISGRDPLATLTVSDADLRDHSFGDRLALFVKRLGRGGEIERLSIRSA